MAGVFIHFTYLKIFLRPENDKLSIAIQAWLGAWKMKKQMPVQI